VHPFQKIFYKNKVLRESIGVLEKKMKFNTPCYGKDIINTIF